MCLTCTFETIKNYESLTFYAPKTIEMRSSRIFGPNKGGTLQLTNFGPKFDFFTEGICFWGAGPRISGKTDRRQYF